MSPLMEMNKKAAERSTLPGTARMAFAVNKPLGLASLPMIAFLLALHRKESLRRRTFCANVLALLLSDFSLFKSFLIER